jgi:hypothetical protein
MDLSPFPRLRARQWSVLVERRIRVIARGTMNARAIVTCAAETSGDRA